MSPLTLSDAYASTLFAQALTRTREAVIDQAEVAPLWGLEPRPAAGGDHSHVQRWDPWVRSYLVAQELVGKTWFKVFPGPAVAGTTEQPMVVQLHFAMDDDLSGWLKAATIVRPLESVFQGQVARVLDWAELRDERSAEILAQIDRQDVFWGAILPVQADRLAATRELLDAAIQFAVFVEMRFKHELACWRPMDYSAQVQPIITTPGHGSLPSGHATQSYMVAEVLKVLMRTASAKPNCRHSIELQLERLAARISINRVVAGVHFPVDNVAGRMLGTVLAEFFAFRAQVNPKRPAPTAWSHRAFLGHEFLPEGDFDPFNQPLPATGKDPKSPFYEADPVKRDDVQAPRDSVLSELWKCAVLELERFQLSFPESP